MTSWDRARMPYQDLLDRPQGPAEQHPEEWIDQPELAPCHPEIRRRPLAGKVFGLPGGRQPCDIRIQRDDTADQRLALDPTQDLRCGPDVERGTGRSGSVSRPHARHRGAGGPSPPQGPPATPTIPAHRRGSSPRHRTRPPSTTPMPRRRRRLYDGVRQPRGFQVSLGVEVGLHHMGDRAVARKEAGVVNVSRPRPGQPHQSRAGAGWPVAHDRLPQAEMRSKQSAPAKERARASGWGRNTTAADIELREP